MSDYKDCVPNEGHLEKDGHGNEKTNSESRAEKAGEKEKHFNVLHEDGTFADLPKGSHPGQGANEGSVGLGT